MSGGVWKVSHCLAAHPESPRPSIRPSVRREGVRCTRHNPNLSVCLAGWLDSAVVVVWTDASGSVCGSSRLGVWCWINMEINTAPPTCISVVIISFWPPPLTPNGD